MTTLPENIEWDIVGLTDIHMEEENLLSYLSIITLLANSQICRLFSKVLTNRLNEILKMAEFRKEHSTTGYLYT